MIKLSFITKYFSLNRIIIIVLILTVIVGVFFLVWIFNPNSITVTNNPKSGLSPLTGLPCETPTRRPVAIMLSSDYEARPLSGLGQADMVFEMPVTPNGITRLMAIFQCGAKPKEIGSIRSARQDFIPLAQGLKAIYAHWGGEHEALANLNNHVIDNIDALTYEGTTFYRKKGVPAPHDGFSTLQLLESRADKLGYTASASLPVYLHQTKPAQVNLTSIIGTVSVDWPLGMDVKFVYDLTNNPYARGRGGQPEIDALTRQQIKVSVVVVMKTTATFLRDQYISVRTLGQGTALIYQNGQRISATWKKSSPQDMLTFTDAQAKPIPLAPGQIWVLIDAPLPQP